MGLLGGGALRLVQTFLYLLAFCCSGIILGIYSYFLAILSDRKVSIATNWKAVVGLSGAAALYTLLAVLLTCFLGGIAAFGYLATVLNLLFAGAFVALVILTRDGAHSCSGTVNTPIGNGDANTGNGYGSGGFGVGSNNNATYAVKLGNACRMNKACFGVAVAGIFLFLVLAVVQVLLVRHHKKEKRFGPSPSNNYTSGTTKRKFWQRGTKGEVAAAGVGATTVHEANKHHSHNTRDTEMAGIRPSHDTGYTGSTMAATNHHHVPVVKDVETGTGNNGLLHNSNHGGVTHATHERYHNQATNTGASPYGYTENNYDVQNPTARNF